MNELTKKAEAMLWENYKLHNSNINFRLVERVLNDPELLKAQGLFTRDEVIGLVMKGVLKGHREPVYDVRFIAESILPSPPKTEL